MRNLFALLWKNQHTVLFIILISFSLFLLSRSYSYHSSLAYNLTSNISGNVFSAYSSITDYLSLVDENELLANENALLKNQLSSSFLQTDTQYIYHDSLYRYIPVKVVSNSVSKRNNFMLVNKGGKHGVKKEMGVVSPLGIVGVVVGVSKNYSTIMSMLHQNMRISAQISGSGQLVNVVWDNTNYRWGSVIDIPSHVRLKQGDTIITSGNSLIFPEGIVIGTIESHQTDNSKNLSRAILSFITDFNSIKHLFIIDNLMKNEQDSLISNVGNKDE